MKMGTPWFKMKNLARQHGILAFSSNYTLYGDMSNRVATILRDFSPDIGSALMKASCASKR